MSTGVLADATMRGLLNRFGQSYLTVPMGTVDERADFHQELCEDQY